MLPELKLNDVIVAENLRVFYCKSLKNDLQSYPLFATSKDAYQSLFSYPQNYFKHLVSFLKVVCLEVYLSKSFLHLSLSL